MISSKAKGAGRLAHHFWPRDKVIPVLKSRYQSLDDLGQEENIQLYGVTDGEVRFVIALILVDGRTDKVAEIGFLSRFSGFTLSNSQLDSVNRNLHISVATFHNDGDLYLIGGVAAAGEFSEGTFNLVLEAWKRDLLVVLHGISASSFVDAVPAGRSEIARRFALNRASEAPERLFHSLTSADRHALCIDCRGRGRTGFFSRQCGSCDGSGFVAHRRG